MEQVEIVFQGTNGLNASEAHPMHLHGHSFYFVGSGLGNFNETSDPESFNLIDPPQVNTVSVPKIGWAAIRFVANNPGMRFTNLRTFIIIFIFNTLLKKYQQRHIQIW